MSFTPGAVDEFDAGSVESEADRRAVGLRDWRLTINAFRAVNG
jgi:hypothetical protein